MGRLLARRVEEDGHRPVVDERHLHVRGEDAGFDGQAVRPQGGTEMVIEVLAKVRGCGAGEAGDEGGAGDGDVCSAGTAGSGRAGNSGPCWNQL